jgi:hypothetical protein
LIAPSTVLVGASVGELESALPQATVQARVAAVAIDVILICTTHAGAWRRLHVVIKKVRKSAIVPCNSTEV